VEFKNRANRDFYMGNLTSSARRLLPATLYEEALEKLTIIDTASSVEDLRVPPSNRLKKLARDRKGQHSIRINDQYRICFVWTSKGAVDVEIVDYH
jgi:proteic killer suppression protein